MKEIKCPNCGQVFQVDESGYAQIVSQVRDAEFLRELQRQEKALAEKREAELKLIKADQEKTAAEKDREIARLNAKLENSETEKKLAMTEAVQQKDAELAEKNEEITRLRSELQLQKQEGELQAQSLKNEYSGCRFLRRMNCLKSCCMYCFAL